jgi:hypothetical protein
MIKRIALLLALTGLSGLTWAQQQTAVLFGKITDISHSQPVELATVYVEELKTFVESNEEGFYLIKVPADQTLSISFSRIGYQEAKAKIKGIAAGTRRRVNVQMVPISSGMEVIVTESRIEDVGMVEEDVTSLKLLPTTTGNLESVLPQIALGTSSGTGGELSSQYNVRGGNYDENLVYVNDFQIYRPQLIRTGQQEGLTFPNIDLTRNLTFSSGGFEARYGDRLSSVLDVRYKRPDSTRASVGLSFLGGSAHVEGSMKVDSSGYRRFRYLLGARYKTTRYLLGSLDIRGEYIPNFTDFQTYLTYDLNRDWQLGVIGNINRADYRFVPTERSTAFGLIDFALELFTVYEGQEVTDFSTYMGGVSLTYLPERNDNPFYLKFLASSFLIEENERFDIIGFYRLGQVESDLGSDSFGDVVSVLGTGTQQQFVRNYLTSIVSNVEHKGGIEVQQPTKDWKVGKTHFFQWGVKYQHEIIDDELNEWERLDSAGYSLPYDPDEVQLQLVLKTRNELRSNRFNAYIQDTYTFQKDSVSEVRLSAGLRASYWDLNGEFLLSPRAQLQVKPLSWKKDYSFRLAAGLYYQPPFYREMRNPLGIVNTDVLAQKSLHIVGGVTHDFKIGKGEQAKPFRFIAEAYYKKLWDLVSYEIDNVRIDYSGENDATGYIAGLDLRINGEFVPDAESWINLSFLRARERLDGVQHLRREIGDSVATAVSSVPRPTDQFMTVSMFFQDYFRNNKNFKMHLNFTVGTGLPYGLRGNNEVFRNTYRFKPYHRVDIGFSLLLWDHLRRAERPNHILRFTRNTWVSLEIFNLMEVANVASNTWIKTFTNTQYSIPNFLTSRRINLRMRVEF